ncbi:glycoside hydrolase/phage tail family protein [Aestuariibius sp. 2305UL40-4]|uniref:baseplate multidomain protein megatron n=1 Tax=Aestuariibius violaceus TaxID=3234132 RepID=UPI00345ECA3B
MATLVLSAAGMAIGGSIGGSVLGLSTAVIGRAAGAALGRVIDQRLMGAGSEAVEVGRIDRFRLTGASEGTPIQRIYGRTRVAGQVIWASRFRERIELSGGGGGGGKGGGPSEPEIKEYSYTISFAVALCEGVIGRVGRIWADGTEISPADLDMRVYRGTEDQLPDPKIEAVEGASNAPAYRGIAYVVIEDLNITRFGNRVPQLSFEVTRPVPGDLPKQDMAQIVNAVAMMPGSGEYALSTKRMRRQIAYGKTEIVNVNTPSNRGDFETSVDALTEELPNCGSVSLVVSWFGNDLRCGDCTIEPKVEWPTGADWAVSGTNRSSAALVAQQDGAAVYGGTPSDRSVIEAIKDLQEHDQKVVFYPFILMEQLAGNGLPDPYSDADNQPVLPWRGRITSSKVLGQPGAPDGTAVAETEVAAFFGQAEPHHFDISGDTVRYTGPQEWSYRRFILHYAYLCQRAGGVDAFCIGSEMRGLTWIRGESNSFPAVVQLKRLAQEVREILGPDTKIGYAADWSEYFGYQPQDGTGDRFFHLDPLWAEEAIDFIGIDNYMPLSDWRDGDAHADAHWGSIYNLDYLTANVAGGEGYDWYYASPEAEAAQIRTPITDEAHGEPWVWRYKDIKNWWSNAHHERIGGVRQADPTGWMPGSKPIWFTEIGCAAIDKGTNEPNKFLDPKSSESSLPKYSNGLRDDFMQLQYLRALHHHWSLPENNPVSAETGLQMVDTTRAHVWAWDARPFPFFPNNREVWSDGANYARGHWITGRATARPLASVVAEICEEAGIIDYDVSALWGIVRGYVTSDVTTGRAALQPLMTAYGFDAIERGGKLVFRTRDGKAGATVNPALMVEGDGTGAIEITRQAKAETSGRVRVNFIEADVDYASAAAEAVFPGDDSASVAQSDLSLTLTRAEGQQIAERWLAEARVARDTATFALPPSRSDIGAGDVIDLPQGGSYRVDRIETTEDRLIEATRVEPESYRPHEVPDYLAPQPSFVPPVPVAATFLDLPLMRGDEVPHAPHVAFTGVPWPGTVALYTAPQDSDYALGDTFAAAAIVGTTESPLFRAPPGRWDRGIPLRVKLVSGALQSVSPAQILSGGNLAAIGDGTPGNWELFQFAAAELVEEDTYDLSLRLRGQAGTDGGAPADWPPGSRFVLIDGIPRQIDLPSAARGTERHFRFGPAIRPLDDPSYDYTVATFEGVGLRPYRPCHLRLAHDGGDIRASWIRRTRIDGESWAGLDVPLGEERESYLVRVTANGKVIRETIVSSPDWIYQAAEQASDGILSNGEIAVAQLSERFGPGPFATIAL